MFYHECLNSHSTWGSRTSILNSVPTKLMEIVLLLKGFIAWAGGLRDNTHGLCMNSREA